VHPGMPKRIENARIALLNCPLEVKKGEFDAKIRIRDPAQMKAFLNKETSMFKEMAGKIKTSGANVVLCQKDIDDLAQHFLAKEGIMAAQRVQGYNIKKLVRATGGRVITNLDDLKRQDFGKAGLVEERKIGEDKMIFVERKSPRSVGVLIRAGLKKMLDEAERAMHDAFSVVADVIEHNKIVAGGGAVESEIARGLREYAPRVGGREQLAVEAFADSVEIVPKTLAENAGLDSIDILVALRAAHEKPRGHLMGVDVFAGKIVDMRRKGVVEPLRVKEQAVKSATEVASMILRIDDMIAATRPKEYRPPPLEEGVE